MDSLPRTVPWLLTDLKKVKPNGFTVMSTFACGGGSTMGYKRAGFDVIAANDIDPQMAAHYKRNHKPRHYYLMPIGDLVKMAKARELPDELYNLDILDGSPPCSSFSMAGNREKDWGKDKHFREGQAKQVLDDLFFDYLDLVAELKPRVSIAENVKGMLVGAAKGYMKEIVRRLRGIGYRTQVFLINGADYGVPQKRERVFFVSTTEAGPSLTLAKTARHVALASAFAGIDAGMTASKWSTLISMRNIDVTGRKMIAEWRASSPGEALSKGRTRLGQKAGSYTRYRCHPNRPCTTLNSTDIPMHWHECRYLTPCELARVSSFPDDYIAQSPAAAHYLMGMSVPPFMTQVVAEAVRDQWLR